MIPHQTKVWELIVDTWGKYFWALRPDLGVGFFPAYILLLTHILCLESSKWNLLHTWHLVRSKSKVLSCNHCPLDCQGRGNNVSPIQSGSGCVSTAWRCPQGYEACRKSFKPVRPSQHHNKGKTQINQSLWIISLSNNNTMLVELEKLLKVHNLAFDAKDCQIWCFAHVVDLSSGQVIKHLHQENIDLS